MAHPGELELLILLAVLRCGDKAYGVTIRDELERETSRTLTLGSVYKTLGRLERKGLPSKGLPQSPCCWQGYFLWRSTVLC